MKTIPNMDVSQGYDDIYRTILIETPVGPYFERFLETLNGQQNTEGGSSSGGFNRPIAAGAQTENKLMEDAGGERFPPLRLTID